MEFWDLLITYKDKLAQKVIKKAFDQVIGVNSASRFESFYLRSEAESIKWQSMWHPNQIRLGGYSTETMPTTCGFPNCRFRSRYRGAEDNRHFYRVPKKPAVLRKRWLDAIGRTEETIVSQLRVCSGHFHGGEKHEGDIPVADPSVDPLVRIELPPKPARILGTTAGPRSGFTLRGGRSRGCGSTLKTKPNILRSGMMNFFNRNGTYNALNTNTTKFANAHPSSCLYGSSTTEHRPYNKWLLNPFASTFEEQASLPDVSKSQHDIGENPVGPGNFISTVQGNEKKSFIKSQSGFNAYNYDNHLAPERPAQGMRSHFPFTPLLPLSHGFTNISAKPHVAGISFKSSLKSSSFESLSPVADSSHKVYLTQHPVGGSQPATSVAALKFSQWVTSLQGMFGSKNADGHFNMQLFTNMFLKMLEKHAPITGPCEAMQSETYPLIFQETPKVCEISSNEAAANISGRQLNGKLMSFISESSKFGRSKMHQNSFSGWPSAGGSSFPAMQVHPINLTNPIHQIRPNIHDEVFSENTLVCDQYDKNGKASTEANSSDNQVASDIVRRPIKPPRTGPGSKIDQGELSLVFNKTWGELCVTHPVEGYSKREIHVSQTNSQVSSSYRKNLKVRQILSSTSSPLSGHSDLCKIEHCRCRYSRTKVYVLSDSTASQQNGGAQKPMVVFRGISDGAHELAVLEDIAEVIIMSTHVESERLERLRNTSRKLPNFYKLETVVAVVVNSDSCRSCILLTPEVKERDLRPVIMYPVFYDKNRGVKFNTIPRELFNVELLCEFIVSLLLVTTNRVFQFGRPRHISLKRPFSVPLEFGKSRWRSSNTTHNQRDIPKRNMIVPNSEIMDDNNWDEMPLVMLPSKRRYGQSVRQLTIGIIAQDRPKFLAMIVIVKKRNRYEQNRHLAIALAVIVRPPIIISTGTFNLNVYVYSDTLIKNLAISLCAFGCTIFVHQSSWTEDIGQLDHTRRFVNMEEMVAEVDWLVVLAGYKCVTDEVGAFVDDNSGAGQLITDSLLLKVKQGFISGALGVETHVVNNACLAHSLFIGLVQKRPECFRHPNMIYLPDYAARILLNAKEHRVFVARIIRQSLLKRKQCFNEANLGMKSFLPYPISSLFENHPFVQSIHGNDSILNHAPKPSELSYSSKKMEEENVTFQRKFGTDSPKGLAEQLDQKLDFQGFYLLPSSTPRIAKHLIKLKAVKIWFSSNAYQNSENGKFLTDVSRRYVVLVTRSSTKNDGFPKPLLFKESSSEY
ncbi:hypothetical protein CLF_104742 [Clonorchis sinensis]|uniref:THAP-type domain-containing protein n=1 Tax=Clonorchis sinensis TaxID=79923 RepID=G7YNY6_CLOSI|nr:hypothetical protein CLF_104742 [Clonorchis sinensis]